MKYALVTGASRGIGAAIADRLAQQDMFVVGTSTTAAGAAAIAERLGDQGHRIVLGTDRSGIRRTAERSGGSTHYPRQQRRLTRDI